LSPLFLESAAWALRDMCLVAVEAIPALIKALQDESSRVRAAATWALESITGQDFGEDAEAWR